MCLWATQGCIEFPLNHTQPTQVLLEVNLRITPQQDCVAAYAPKRITDGMICAGPEAGSGDTCKGDYAKTCVELVCIIFAF